jgi:hypothetical protein
MENATALVAFWFFCSVSIVANWVGGFGRILPIRFRRIFISGKLAGVAEEITSFSSGSQNKSSSPTPSRPRRKESGEFRANTYIATSVRSKYAIGDGVAEIEPAEEVPALAMPRQPGSARRAA